MKPETVFLIVVAVFSVVLLVNTVPSNAGLAVKYPFGIFIPNALVIKDLVIPGFGQSVYQDFPSFGDFSDLHVLRPVSVEFFVDSILVPPFMNEYNFLPLKKDRMRSFSGRFGPYSEDYRDVLYVELCSFVLSHPDMISCEKIIDLNFVDGYVTFARGYDFDEFIAGLAMRNFGAYYVVQSKEFGHITESNAAVINLV